MLFILHFFLWLFWHLDGDLTDWRFDCVLFFHQKLWIVVDKRLPVVFIGIFHLKLFCKPYFSLKASWGIDFSLFYKWEGYSSGQIAHPSLSMGSLVHLEREFSNSLVI